MVEAKGGGIITHTVRVTVGADTLTYDPCCVHANPGERITWEIGDHHGLAVIIKAFEGPLEARTLSARMGEPSITATVRRDAKPGFYPYALVAATRGALLVADPEIIVPPPDGRGGR